MVFREMRHIFELLSAKNSYTLMDKSLSLNHAVTIVD